MEEAGYEYIIGQKKETITSASSTLPELVSYKLIDSTIFHLGFQERILNSLRILKHNLPGIINWNFLKNISNPCFLLGTRTQQEITSYCNENRLFPVQVSPLWFANNGLVRRSCVHESYRLQEFVRDFLSRVGEKHPIFGNSILELLEKSVNQSFQDSLFFFYSAYKILGLLKNRALLITGIGNILHRVLSAAWRYSGGEVIGFVHGNAYCTCYSPVCTTDGYLSILSHYVANSYGYEMILKQAIHDFPLGLDLSVKITHLKKSYYRPLFTELQKNDPVRRIETVMLIGFPMNDSMYAWYPERHAFSQLRLELGIVKLLKAAGYNVIYKAHPERINEVEGIFDEYADKVLSHERLEVTFDCADCLIFSYAYTTAFGFSLLTKKPIVLINVKGETWFPRAFQLLERRCCIVNAETDDSGRIFFNDQDLLTGVEASLHNISYEVLNEFAF